MQSPTDDKPQGGGWAQAKPLLQQVFHSVAAFDFIPVGVLPPCRRPVPGFDESLLEHVVQDVLQVYEFVILKLEFNELRGSRFSGVGAGSHVISEP